MPGSEADTGRAEDRADGGELAAEGVPGAPGEHVAAIHAVVARIFGERARVRVVRAIEHERGSGGAWVSRARAAAIEGRSPRRARGGENSTP